MPTPGRPNLHPLAFLSQLAKLCESNTREGRKSPTHQFVQVILKHVRIRYSAGLARRPCGSLLYDHNVHHSLPPSLSMSVTLQPSESLGFNRASFLLSLDPSPTTSFLTSVILQGPLTQNVKCSLNITNPNVGPVSFKVKTTAPKVRPSRVGT